MSVTASLNIDVLAGGTVILTASFKDEEGASVTPNSLKYTLLDNVGNVVNSQQDITVSPATSVDVTLSGDDLPPGKLYWVVEGTYDSSAGTDLPLKGYATFNVQRLPEA